MIKIYDKYADGRMKIFFYINEDGEVTRTTVGNQAVSVGRGLQFYVDDYVADQIDKCELVIERLPILKVKEGETLHVPKENDEYLKQKRIEELEEELRRLREDD